MSVEDRHFKHHENNEYAIGEATALMWAKRWIANATSNPLRPALSRKSNVESFHRDAQAFLQRKGGPSDEEANGEH